MYEVLSALFLYFARSTNQLVCSVSCKMQLSLKVSSERFALRFDLLKLSVMTWATVESKCDQSENSQ